MSLTAFLTHTEKLCNHNSAGKVFQTTWPFTSKLRLP